MKTVTEFLAYLKADSSQAVAEFNKAGDKINKSMDRASSSVTRLDNAMERLGRGLVGGVAFGQIINLSKDMVQSTAKLEDTIAAAGVTFGNFSADIEQFAKDAATNFGLSTVAALDAANTFAALGKSAGLTGQDLTGFSKQMVALAGDLSSFRGTSVEEAITAIGSGLRGEAEPLRRFGVLLDDATLKARAMTMGIYAGTGALTPQQKVLAAHAEILAQTSDAQGDFARTADSTANSLKTASAEMENAKAAAGEALAPAMTALAQAVAPALSAFGSLDDEIQSLITITGLGVAAFSSASQALQGLGVAASTANMMLGPVVAVMTVATLAYAAHTREKAAQERTTQGLVDVLQQENSARKENLALLALNDENVKIFVEGMTALGVSTDEVAEYVQTGNGRLADMADEIDRVMDSTQGTYPELAALSEEILGQSLAGDTLNEKYQNMTAEQIAAAVAVRDFRNQLDPLRTEFVNIANVTDLVAAATGGATGSSDEFNTMLNETRSRLQAANAEYQRQLDLVDELYSGQRDAIERQRDYTESQLELKTVMGDTNSTLDEQLQAVIGMSEEFGTLTGAALDSRDGTLRQIESLDTFLSTIDPSSPLYQAVKDYRDILAQIPTNVDTLLRLNLVAGKLVTNEGDIIDRFASLGEVDERAMGGPVSAGSPYLVGERGPELIVPSTSGTVIPNGALGGTTILNVTVTNPIASGEQLANELAAYTRRNGSAWLSGAR